MTYLIKVTAGLLFVSLLFGVALSLCSCGQKTRPQDHQYKVLVDGIERNYIVHVPPSYTSTVSTPVVLSFHGGGVDAEQQMALSGLNQAADNHGFLVVYPEGTSALFGRWNTWNAGSCCGKAEREKIDDVKFTAMIIDDLSKNYNINRRRVFATGMSNGGMMVYRLACELADRISAIAPVAATLAVEKCEPKRPISVLHFHGRADEFVPFSGGYGKNPDNGSFRSVDDTIALFVSLDKCQTPPQTTYDKGDVSCVTYQCAEKTAVVLCSIKGGGHTWPEGSPFPKGGRTTQDISANEAMWRFFESHPMPEQ